MNIQFWSASMPRMILVAIYKNIIKNKSLVICDAVHLLFIWPISERSSKNCIFIVNFSKAFWFTVYFGDPTAISGYAVCFIHCIIFFISSCQCCMWRQLCHNCSWNTFNLRFLFLFFAWHFFFLLLFIYVFIFCIVNFLHSLHFLQITFISFPLVFANYFAFFIMFIH